MNIVILITTKDKKEAKKITDHLVAGKLIACANIVHPVNSVFWWQGKVNNQSESLLVIKSRKVLLNKIIKKVKSLHSYTVPEIIALPIVGGNKDYLNWIKDSTQFKK